MPLQQQTLAAGTEVSRYRVERLVARGGMGLVYRAWDLRLDRPVALEVLSPELSDDERFREWFVRESRLAAAVDHPNVIPVYEAEDWEGMAVGVPVPAGALRRVAADVRPHRRLGGVHRLTPAVRRSVGVIGVGAAR